MMDAPDHSSPPSPSPSPPPSSPPGSAASATPWVACVDIPALSLQLVLREHPAWRQEPTVIVEDDRPLAEIIWSNRPARALSITRGMRFGHARSLSATLRAQVVSEQEITAAVDALLATLYNFSPKVEPVRALPGLFWLDPNGLDALYLSLESWAASVQQAMTDQNFVGAVVVGRRRARVLAIAKQHLGVLVLRDESEEKRRAERVYLAQLDLSPKLYTAMAALGVHTLGAFLALPGPSLRSRYGEEAAALHEAASGKAWTPLRPEKLAVAFRASIAIEPASADISRLIFALKSELDNITHALGRCCEAITALYITLQLDHAGAQREHLESAAPTLDAMQLLELLRLRLSTIALPAAVEQIEVEVITTKVRPEQATMLLAAKKRDLEAANRALARVRAAFGRESVTHARLRDAWLPEARFAWDPLLELSHPTLDPHHRGDDSPLLRDVRPMPVRLPSRPEHEPGDWLRNYGILQQLHGPMRLSGGWWVRRVERDYYFAELHHGDILWIYYDRPRRHWMLQGVID